MATKLFTAQQMKDLMYSKNVMLRNHTVSLIGYDYSDGELILTYFINGNLADVTLTHEEIKRAIQFDPSVKAFDDRSIVDEDNVNYDYESYFDTCPQALLIDFIFYTLSYRANDNTNNNSFTQNKAA